MNPRHVQTAWNALQRATEISAPPVPNAIKTSEPHREVSELKRLLNNSAGKHLAITVQDGDSEKKFDVVLPKDFAR
jgi:hypothetical protein